MTKAGTDPITSFPAGGDSSYPGLICPEAGKLIISFYSNVVYQSGQVKPKFHPVYKYKYTASDIYLAELAVETGLYEATVSTQQRRNFVDQRVKNG